MLASDIISRVRIVLNDLDATRNPDAELLGWINDGQRVIAVIRPDSCSAQSVVSLVAGTKQTIPTDGLRLLDVIRNIAADGSTPGRVVRQVDRDLLDTQDANWHSATQSGTVRNFTFDNRIPKTFFVYPPAASGTKVEVLYSKSPVDVATTSDAISLSDAYAEPLLNYVLYRAYSKEAEFVQNANLASLYLGVFNSMLGIKTGKDAAFSPDLNSRGKTTPVAPAIQMGGV